MAKAKAATAEQKRERAKDRRLQKTYGITLDQYNEILKAQDGKCAICGRPATDFTVSLNVDHKHFKIEAKRLVFPPANIYPPAKWAAFVHDFDFVAYGATKQEVIKMAKDAAMPYSVRGLLCPGRHMGCNRLLGRVDKPVWLQRALDYLNDPPAKKVLDFSTKME